MKRIFILQFLLFFVSALPVGHYQLTCNPEQGNEKKIHNTSAHKIERIKKIVDGQDSRQPLYTNVNQFTIHKELSQCKVNDYLFGLFHAYGIGVPKGCFPPVGYIKTGYQINFQDIYLPKACFADVMKQIQLYAHDNFWHFIQTFPDYEALFVQIFEQPLNNELQSKIPRHIFNRIEQEYSRLYVKRQNQLVKNQQNQIQNQFMQSLPELQKEWEDWCELGEIAYAYDFQNQDHFSKRYDTFNAINNGDALYDTQAYVLSDDVVGLLTNSGCELSKYKLNYGNQLQQALHQECINIVQQTARLKADSPVYEYKESLVDLADASREFNQIGQSYKASILNDFCFAFLDYGCAFVEGVTQGVIGAVHDMVVEHPFETLACVVAGKYVLAYQLLKVTTQLAEIGITYLVDEQAGKEKWEDYIQPITALVDALSKKELTLRDGIRGATAVGVGYLTQRKMLKGLGSIYKKAQVKAIEFAKNNPLVHPEAYMATSEGVVLKSTNDITNNKFNEKSYLTKIESIEHKLCTISDELAVKFSQRSLQHAFDRHANDFGIFDKWNKQSACKFKDFLINHIETFEPIKGTYRGTQEVFHYFDLATHCNVMTDLMGNFIGGWKLSNDQVKYLLSTGALK